MDSLAALGIGLEVTELILVKVQAYNLRGWGDLSEVNTSGATFKTVPTKMAVPQRDSATTDSSITVSWTALTTTADIGNSAITSYELQWDAGSSGASFTSLVGGSSSYT